MSISASPSPRRQKRAPSHARGRLMLPKLRPRRWKPEEHRAFHAAPLWALESQAERLLVQLINRAHLAGVVVEDELPVALLEVRLPRHMLEELVTSAVAREDLEPETDQGVDDEPHDDLNDDREQDADSEPSCGWGADPVQTARPTGAD